MFTLKFFSATTDSYRCVAVREFEISRVPDGSVNVLMRLIHPEDTTHWNFTVNAGEKLIVENANGKTIDVVRADTPNGYSLPQPEV